MGERLDDAGLLAAVLDARQGVRAYARVERAHAAATSPVYAMFGPTAFADTLLQAWERGDDDDILVDDDAVAVWDAVIGTVQRVGVAGWLLRMLHNADELMRESMNDPTLADRRDTDAQYHDDVARVAANVILGWAREDGWAVIVARHLLAGNQAEALNMLLPDARVAFSRDSVEAMRTQLDASAPTRPLPPVMIAPGASEPAPGDLSAAVQDAATSGAADAATGGTDGIPAASEQHPPLPPATSDGNGIGSHALLALAERQYLFDLDHVESAYRRFFTRTPETPGQSPGETASPWDERDFAEGRLIAVAGRRIVAPYWQQAVERHDADALEEGSAVFAQFRTCVRESGLLTLPPLALEAVTQIGQGGADGKSVSGKAQTTFYQGDRVRWQAADMACVMLSYLPDTHLARSVASRLLAMDMDGYAREAGSFEGAKIR